VVYAAEKEKKTHPENQVSMKRAFVAGGGDSKLWVPPGDISNKDEGEREDIGDSPGETSQSSRQKKIGGRGLLGEGYRWTRRNRFDLLEDAEWKKGVPPRPNPESQARVETIT